MATLEKMKTTVNNQIDHAQIKVEALQFQASFGNKALIDNIQLKLKSMMIAAISLSQYLETIGAAVGEAKNAINIEIDNLQMQVVLGDMEGKESVESVKDSLTKYAGQFEKSLELTKNIEQEKITHVYVKLFKYMEKISILKASVEAKLESYDA